MKLSSKKRHRLSETPKCDVRNQYGVSYGSPITILCYDPFLFFCDLLKKQNAKGWGEEKFRKTDVILMVLT